MIPLFFNKNKRQKLDEVIVLQLVSVFKTAERKKSQQFARLSPQQNTPSQCKT